MLVTTFDNEKLMNLIGEKTNYKYEYTNDNGELVTLYDIVKKYNMEDIKNNKLGNSIDVYLSWISPVGRYLTEYLVDKEFIVNDVHTRI